ncbi:hypothetical protein AAJCM20276_10650 [Acetobacter aceti]|uniref:Uncharacterized protein n=1 Tax=Acetobacter aceti TaxID=435 RepID=A0A6S6PII7_ACEAC|nr:hypothetical protein AAJCM20276_10650 [Acetobacter aceti]
MDFYVFIFRYRNNKLINQDLGIDKITACNALQASIDHQMTYIDLNHPFLDLGSGSFNLLS